jgi:hypothetical protein
VRFGRFLKQRPDDRVVELFLAWWAEGTFAADPGWLPQHVENVEAIAKDSNGNTLAIEHTRIYAFDGHQADERRLAELAMQIESAAELLSPGREYRIILPKEVFEELDARKRCTYARSLIEWLSRELKLLSLGERKLMTPALPPKTRGVELSVVVDEAPAGSESIRISGMLPDSARARAVPQVTRALECKLPKLKAAVADNRVLLIELPTIDTSPTLIADVIISSEYADDLRAIDFVVLAKTVTNNGGGSAWFFAHDTKDYVLGDIGHVTWGPYAERS